MNPMWHLAGSPFKSAWEPSLAVFEVSYRPFSSSFFDVKELM
jgi:hypothetical protein